MRMPTSRPRVSGRDRSTSVDEKTVVAWCLAGFLAVCFLVQTLVGLA